MSKTEKIKGYKVFNPNWTCRDKQYTCPGKFEEDTSPSVCGKGMHFCKKAVDCFGYYSFDPKNKVAEVVAYGKVKEDNDKCCTDKLEILREIPWAELLEIVNTGKGCTGYRNSGDFNSGGYNTGDCNTGDYNAGYRNSDDCNSSICNTSRCNSGNHNSGDFNSGNHNSGNCNSGDCNSGDFNSGDCNSGDFNSGNHNSGDFNSGDCNTGNHNSGYYNKTNHSNGWFNTIECGIPMFNKISSWTESEANSSEAKLIMDFLAGNPYEWVRARDMTDEEKKKYPKYKTTDGYLKEIGLWKDAVEKWNGLSEKEKNIAMSIPNFDKEIFKETTGIDVDIEI